MPTNVHRFASIEAFLSNPAHVKAIENSSHYTRSDGHSWDLGISGRQALELTASGDETIVPATDEILCDITPQLGDFARPTTIHAYSGSSVAMGRYLSGSPRCMRARKRAECPTRIVRIYAEITCLASVTAAQMLKRGQYVIALLRSLQAAGITVELFATHHGDSGASADHIIVIPINPDNAPLNLSQASFAIAHPAFFRNVAMPVAHGCYRHQFRNPNLYNSLGSDRYSLHMRDVLGMDPADVYIPQAIPGGLAITDPAEWLRQTAIQIVGAE